MTHIVARIARRMRRRLRPSSRIIIIIVVVVVEAGTSGAYGDGRPSVTKPGRPMDVR
jgi:hypothetical protein